MKTLLRSVLCLPVLLWAEPSAPVPVWDAAPPAETLKAKPGQDPKGILNKNGHRTDVMIPEFVVWPAAKPNAPFIIVCPGGGYGILAEEHEGAEVARRLNAQGVGAAVLRYRVPRRDNDKPWVVPVLDARKTIELVRAHAAEWNADPKKIGILGFSAGGNLAARVAYSPVHVWSKGGHGWGASDRCLAAKEWTNTLGAWLKDRGILTP
ncbi:MAG: alpha/beta hydrolase [Verrucomicrobiae bacterium]|nr:alpha/beta hydrolase [Verrucomicrobiae bacterium]